MTKDQKDNLFSLVKSLTKSEKRQFKLYVGRLGVNTDSKFLNLFNVLDKLKTYDEVTILKSNQIQVLAPGSIPMLQIPIVQFQYSILG